MNGYDTLDIGPTPPGEDCQQVGTRDYDPMKARKECHAYIGVLRRKYGEEPEGARLIVKSNPHDFGSYLSVVCKYDPEDEAAANYALDCESGDPEFWDDEARKELGL